MKKSITATDFKYAKSNLHYAGDITLKQMASGVTKQLYVTSEHNKYGMKIA